MKFTKAELEIMTEALSEISHMFSEYSTATKGEKRALSTGLQKLLDMMEKMKPKKKKPKKVRKS